MKKHLLTLMMAFGGLLLNAQNIYNGQTLEQDRKYWSNNNSYYLIFQNDGNLVLYNRAGASIWDAKTTNRGVKLFFRKMVTWLFILRGMVWHSVPIPMVEEPIN
jgi:hypothetical protein